MLWAIDVGNTQTVVGVWDESWRATWRLATDFSMTEDELAAMLKPLCDLDDIPFEAQTMVVASVVPAMNFSLARLAQKHFAIEALFLTIGDQVGLAVEYQPKNAVGADRIANAVAALQLVAPPIVIVDFGTATTFDAISKERVYVGGAILPGVQVSMEALIGRTAKLPQIDLVAPKHAIGKSTVESLQSGIMLGYAGAIDALARRTLGELGGGTVIATGGLSVDFMGLCDCLERHEPLLTLEGLRMAAPKLLQARLG